MSLPYEDTVNQEPALRILQFPGPGTFHALITSNTQGSEYDEAGLGNFAASYQKYRLRPKGLQTLSSGNIRCSWEQANGKQPHAQSISPNREPSLDPLTYRHVDSRISTTTSLRSLSILRRPGPGLPIESIKLEAQDGNLPPPSPEDEEKFKSQLSKIWDRMMTFEKTPQWEKIISSMPKEKWLSRIMEHTPENVKSMLLSPHPPTPAQLRGLPWSNTTNCGVFAWCTEAIGEQDSSAEKTLYVYVGSASNCRGGLSIRKKNMLAQLPKPHDEALKLKIKDLDLHSKGDFKELLVVSFENDFAGDVMEVKALVILARFALMIWLGAVDEKMKLKIKDIVPWELEKIKYVGLAGDNPLLLEINEGSKQKKGGD